MSLANFSLPYQLATPSPYVFTGSHGPQSTISNLRLNAVLPPPPAPSFNDEHGYQNVPYIPPARYQQQHQQQQQRQREQQLRAQEAYSGQQQQQQQQQHGVVVSSSFSSGNQDTRYANYNQDFRRTQPRQQQIPQQHISPQSQHQQQPRPAIPQHHQPHQHHQQQQQQQLPRVPVRQEQDHVPQNGQQNGPQNGSPADEDPENYPGRPGDGYTRVNGGTYGSPGAKTSVHAILDYDDDEEENRDDYYDDGDSDVPKDTRVTPIQGPIFLKNGSVPVVPLYSYPQLNNGTFVQIPILWTALSVALGVELRGDLVRGTPCIKRYHQLFCPTAGKTYPIERIEQFIDENKALMKRMYGDFEMDEDYGSPTREPGTRRRRNTKKHDLPDGGPSLPDENRRKRREPDPRVVEGGESFFSKVRNARQTLSNSRGNESGRVDACESKVEIVTPYWASNSAGKVRAIVNTQHFEQAIHQEVCSKTKTNRCTSDCGCEQKYKWHRLLAYDPDNDCKGIFMDWFLFPSCCVCRCDPPNRKFPTTTSRN